jgi:hypothetical protein
MALAQVSHFFWDFVVNAGAKPYRFCPGVYRLPSNSTISFEAKITMEVETGWIREFILEHETLMKSEVSFQGIEMKMDTRNIIKGKAIVTRSN